VRLVLDTNVLIAAYATEGACMRLYKHCIRRHTMVTSEILVEELREKLLRKLKISPPDVIEIIASYRERCEIVSPRPLPFPVSRDPDDDWVIATAVAGECACIVSGDNDLLALGAYEGIRMIRPGSFWEFESGASEG
jgi:putative PIN family toxin of toxin-antitoxin system